MSSDAPVSPSHDPHDPPPPELEPIVSPAGATGPSQRAMVTFLIFVGLGLVLCAIVVIVGVLGANDY